MFKYLKQNKHIVAIAVTLFIISMSTLMFFLGTNNDPNHKDLKTDVIHAGESSKESEESKYRKLIHNEKDPLIILNLDGSIKFTSANFEKTLGYKEEELSYHLFFLLIHRDDLSSFVSAFGKVLQTQEAVTVIGPYRIQDKEGLYHFNIASAFPIMEKEKVQGVAVVTKDITSSLKELESKKGIKEKENGTKILNEKDKEELRLMAGTK